jgi:hypothetical protein
MKETTKKFTTPQTTTLESARQRVITATARRNAATAELYASEAEHAVALTAYKAISANDLDTILSGK